ncbi:hypothetical protein [uncultured Parasphingorhabdus sp.]|uniref:hypothetical protein n=1 Tax=uncultured Parasphingorhabdus sp. TaxID=2709694 RepID=UPI002AA628FD|nr:hypothetical protein [uncultured Parasphingorhabdus sp.]
MKSSDRRDQIVKDNKLTYEKPALIVFSDMRDGTEGKYYDDPSETSSYGPS